MLCRRSASLIRITRTSFAIASSILRKFSACASSRVVNSIWSSFETPSTMSATGLPNEDSISALVTVVSSVTSCSSAAARPCASSRHCDRMLATASGCVMYGSPDLRNCPRCADSENSNARSTSAISGGGR
jgi:hypothetical protein